MADGSWQRRNPFWLWLCHVRFYAGQNNGVVDQRARQALAFAGGHIRPMAEEVLTYLSDRWKEEIWHHDFFSSLVEKEKIV